MKWDLLETFENQNLITCVNIYLDFQDFFLDNDELPGMSTTIVKGHSDSPSTWCNVCFVLHGCTKNSNKFRSSEPSL